MVNKNLPLIVAFIMSAIWVKFSGIYTYGNDMYIFGINILTLVLWVAGLMVLQYIYETYGRKRPFIQIIIFYWVGLLIIEYIGYHLIGIQLQSNYSGVFGLDVLHVPLFAKVYYMSAGPIYLLVLDYMKKVKTRW